MATPTSPARRRILEVLADGDWHTRDELLDAAATAVAPGQAWRTGEARRHRYTTAARTRGDDTTSIATGARTVARKALEHLTRTGTVTVDGDHIRLVTGDPAA